MALEQESTPQMSVTEPGCPIRMGDYTNIFVCGRKLHAAPEGIDEQPVCLMHSKDPDKQSGWLNEEFWAEFKRILEVASDSEAHFEKFVFPEVHLSGRRFIATCFFIQTTFLQNVDFHGTTFTKNADFTEATFNRDADFNEIIFAQKAYFGGATFKQEAYFCGVTFTMDTNFREATFMQNAIFIGTTFTQKAEFNHATFKLGANFNKTTFMLSGEFEATNFQRTATFMYSKFLDRAEFRHTKFEIRGEKPNPIFTLVQFAKPGEIVFEDVDLSRAIFYNCDVSRVEFTSSVQWAKRRKNRGLAIFEETFLLKNNYTEEIQQNSQQDYAAIAQIYQQLKKNYDSRLDYWTANQFHYGEMEMKRLAPPEPGRLFRGGWMHRWLHRNLRLVALYQRASDYGNSSAKPAAWILAILLLFSVLLPLPGIGLRHQSPEFTQTYISVWDKTQPWTPNLVREARTVGKAGITALDTVTFQRNPEYLPGYPWGRVLAIGATLLISSLFALFLLAIRRQFKR